MTDSTDYWQGVSEDQREQEIRALAPYPSDAPWNADVVPFLLRRLDEAERRGAVKALRAMAEQSYNYDDPNHYADALDRRATAIENGADL